MLKTQKRQVHLPQPHSGQQIVRAEARRHNWLAAGRRWRKTTLAMAICIEGALEGEEWIWGAPTVDQTRNAWREMRTAAGDVAQFRKAEHTVEFPGGGRVLLRSLDNPDNTRGWTADGVVIDESADVSDTAWYEVLRPMLVDTGGVSWCLGTPKGRNWFWVECANAGSRDDSAFWNPPTLGMEITPAGLVRVPHRLENPFIKFNEMQQVHRSTPDRVFRQEFLAEFIEESGGVFRGVEDVVVKGLVSDTPPRSGCRYVIGVDLARVQDWTVVSVLEVRPGQPARQVYLERFNQIAWARMILAIVSAARRYGNAKVVVDATGVGDPIFEELRKQNLNVEGFHISSSSKEKLIDGAAVAIEHKQVYLMDVQIQTDELQAYQYELTVAGNVRMGAPPGMHDDTVIALALAIHGIGRTPTWDAA